MSPRAPRAGVPHRYRPHPVDITPRCASVAPLYRGERSTQRKQALHTSALRLFLAETYLVLSHAMPSPSRSSSERYPGSPLYIGAAPAARGFAVGVVGTVLLWLRCGRRLGFRSRLTAITLTVRLRCRLGFRSNRLRRGFGRRSGHRQTRRRRGCVARRRGRSRRPRRSG